jgi:hypothetical protein
MSTLALDTIDHELSRIIDMTGSKTEWSAMMVLDSATIDQKKKQ